MLDNRGGVENFLEGFDKFATGLTYSWKMLKSNLQNNCSPFIVFSLLKAVKMFFHKIVKSGAPSNGWKKNYPGLLA